MSKHGHDIPSGRRHAVTDNSELYAVFPYVHSNNSGGVITPLQASCTFIVRMCYLTSYFLCHLAGWGNDTDNICVRTCKNVQWLKNP